MTAESVFPERSGESLLLHVNELKTLHSWKTFIRRQTWSVCSHRFKPEQSFRAAAQTGSFLWSESGREEGHCSAEPVSSVQTQEVLRVQVRSEVNCASNGIRQTGQWVLAAGANRLWSQVSDQFCVWWNRSADSLINSSICCIVQRNFHVLMFQ